MLVLKVFFVYYIPIVICVNVIKCVNTFKILGVIMDNDLK